MDAVYARRIWQREEDFLEMYHGTVEAVLPTLGVPWQPDYRCNDVARQLRAQFIRAGRQKDLAFELRFNLS